MASVRGDVPGAGGGVVGDVVVDIDGRGRHGAAVQGVVAAEADGGARTEPAAAGRRAAVGDVHHGAGVADVGRLGRVPPVMRRGVGGQGEGTQTTQHDRRFEHTHGLLPLFFWFQGCPSASAFAASGTS